MADTARQLVADEVFSLVGEPWNRKGESPLRRNGATTSTIYLDRNSPVSSAEAGSAT